MQKKNKSAGFCVKMTYFPVKLEKKKSTLKYPGSGVTNIFNQMRPSNPAQYINTHLDIR